MAKFKMGPEGPVEATTARVRAANGTTLLVDADVGKLVKFSTIESEYRLAAVGDKIDGVVVAIAPAKQDGISIGSVQTESRLNCICEGSQAAGTGSMAIGDRVVCGTVVVAGTAMTATNGPKVRTATNQPGAVVDVGATVNQTTVNAALALVADQMLILQKEWRVISLGNAGAVGDTCVIERVGC
jgi:hypothetical protein